MVSVDVGQVASVVSEGVFDGDHVMHVSGDPEHVCFKHRWT
jgi:hypothetical protein